MPPDAPAIAIALHRALRPLQAEPLWTCARRILAGRPTRVWPVASLVATVDEADAETFARTLVADHGEAEDEGGLRFLGEGLCLTPRRDDDGGSVAIGVRVLKGLALAHVGFSFGWGLREALRERDGSPEDRPLHLVGRGGVVGDIIVLDVAMLDVPLAGRVTARGAPPPEIEARRGENAMRDQGVWCGPLPLIAVRDLPVVCTLEAAEGFAGPVPTAGRVLLATHTPTAEFLARLWQESLSPDHATLTTRPPT